MIIFRNNQWEHSGWPIDRPTPDRPIGIGILGTGFAAKLRATAIQENPRCRLVGVGGRDPERTHQFSATFGVPAFTPETLLAQANRDPERDTDLASPLDLVVVTTVNALHGPLVRSALERGLHVVVDYPLSLTAAEATDLIALAQRQRRLLHVEHIELLGGWHQSLRQSLPQIGTPRWVRYATIKVDRPAPDRWGYHRSQFGFPFIGALSRIHRLTDVLGPVASVSCQAQYWPVSSLGTAGDPSPGDPVLPSPGFAPKTAPDAKPHPDRPDRFGTCLCTAQLFFQSGALATVTYGKGEALWRNERYMEVQGDRGALRYDQDAAVLVTETGETALDVGGRRGLFAQDTEAVVAYLLEDKPLYIYPAASLYALQVAEAAQRAAATGQTQPMQIGLF
ncbi:MAG: Gfo/Idh/MocA family oxidoreductase [Prochlorothrix sp.]|nr:Gfo/Idh/MocA family oxidoreductase [Prochlorothrix sp.]